MLLARFLPPLAIVTACGLAAAAACSDASNGNMPSPGGYGQSGGGSGTNGSSAASSSGSTVSGTGNGGSTSNPGGGGAPSSSSGATSGGGSTTTPGGSSSGGGSDDSGTSLGTSDDGGLLADGGSLDDETNPFVGLPTGAAQLKVLCARNNGDAVSKAFCGATPPTITSLVDLQTLLGLDFKPGNIGNGTGGNPAFVLSGHSTSLVTQFTSAINPRAIIFTPPNSRGRVNKPNPLASFVAMGFVRGEEFVELVSNDPTANNALRFFLFNFSHECTTSATGCTFGDLLTPAVESNFTGVYSLYQEDDIKDTIFDCQQCHQPGGPTTTKILRMQELQNPWGHFFRNNRINGEVLLSDYQAAHGTTETYAGIPGAVIFNPNTTNNNGNVTTGGGPDPAALEGLVENQGFQDQPNEYTTGTILKQVQAVNPQQPGVNVPAGTSTIWQALYANSMAGLDIPVPYHDIKVTDPTKLATATTAYQAVMNGTMPSSQLPDIRNIFLDSALSDLSFQPAAGLDGQGILVQMCQQCHNSKLDQTETRERFRVDQLSEMSQAEKDLAVHRLSLPATAFRRMPPPRFRSLSAAEIQAVTTVLSQ